jgi:hypothetical protein
MLWLLHKSKLEKKNSLHQLAKLISKHNINSLTAEIITFIRIYYEASVKNRAL